MTKFQRSKTRALNATNPFETKSKTDQLWQIEPLLCVVFVLSVAVFLLG